MKKNNFYKNDNRYNPYSQNQHGRYLQFQEQISASAYEWKTTHDIFLRMMNWLEKYIEIVGCYPDWEQRKRIRTDWIKRTDVNSIEGAEKALSNRLLVFKRILEEPFRDELAKEFYGWIGATGINADNCPERLKYFLFGINEILEGRGEKFEEDAKNKKRVLDPNSPEYSEELNKVFTSIQSPLRNEREVEESLEGKDRDEIAIEDGLVGDDEQGKEEFDKLAETVSTSNYNEFRFFPQREEQQQNFENPPFHPQFLEHLLYSSSLLPQ